MPLTVGRMARPWATSVWAGTHMPAVIAIAAHPDDIEFMMAGTLLRLQDAGWRTHYLCIASGNCGSVTLSGARTRTVRRRESHAAARVLGAQFHRNLTDDMELVYDVRLLRRLAGIIRDVKPTVVLTHSPQDYMEDHTQTCRLAVSAAFTHGMPNFKTIPSRPAAQYDISVYHAMPHGLRDGLRKRIVPGAFVDTTTVHDVKQRALASHRSQQGWLATSQGMNSYLRAMDDMSREVGRLSRHFTHAEGWRRHLHIGLSAAESDPLRDALGKFYLVNKAYERMLEAL